jgi:hypothetical protein
LTQKQKFIIPSPSGEGLGWVDAISMVSAYPKLRLFYVSVFVAIAKPPLSIFKPNPFKNWPPVMTLTWHDRFMR